MAAIPRMNTITMMVTLLYDGHLYWYNHHSRIATIPYCSFCPVRPVLPGFASICPVWPHLAPFGRVWPHFLSLQFMLVFSHILIHLTLIGNISPQFSRIEPHLAPFGPISPCLAPFSHVWPQ